MVIKSEKGQTVVEYLLLLTVAISLVMTFYKSEAYRRLFGTEGTVGLVIKESTEFGYRHAYLQGRPPGPYPIQYVGPHPSYCCDIDGLTRFFGPKAQYP